MTPNPNIPNRDHFNLAVDRIRQAHSLADRRLIVGIAGPAGSGKSTLSEVIVAGLNTNLKPGQPDIATLLPMDGYHLDNRILKSRCQLNRKGAPETFDSLGLLSNLKRVLGTDGFTYHPAFSRDLDLVVGNAIALHPQTPIVVIEGSYLFLDMYPWNKIRELIDLRIFLKVPKVILTERLMQRWTNHGFTIEEARKKVEKNDLLNIRLVAGCSMHSDLLLSTDLSA